MRFFFLVNFFLVVGLYQRNKKIYTPAKQQQLHEKNLIKNRFEK